MRGLEYERSSYSQHIAVSGNPFTKLGRACILICLIRVGCRVFKLGTSNQFDFTLHFSTVSEYRQLRLTELEVQNTVKRYSMNVKCCGPLEIDDFRE